MKLEQVNINGYGNFYNFQLDIKPGLNVVYGLNGSGKTTFLSFIRTCFYGFNPRNSQYRYEPFNGGTHGGNLRVSTDNKQYLISRSADRSSKGLLQIEDLITGQQLAQTSLNNLLGSVSQAVFESVFAFGLSDLQKLEFLKDQDLNALLYSVALGSSISLGEVNNLLVNKMDNIYKPRGSKPQLNQILKSITQINQQLSESKIVSSQYEQLVDLIETTKSEISSHKTEISQLKHELLEVQNLLDAWPHWQQLVVIDTRLVKLPNVELPSQGIERLEAVDTRLIKLNQEYHDLVDLMPGVKFIAKTQCNHLKNEIKDLTPELEEARMELKLSRERRDYQQIEIDSASDQLILLEAEIEQLSTSKTDLDLTIKQQLIDEMRQLQQELASGLSKKKPTAHKYLAYLGWLFMGIIFFFSDQITGLILTSVMFATFVIIGIREYNILKKQHKLASKRFDQLKELFSIKNESEIAILVQDFEVEQILTQKRKQLLSLKNKLELKIDRLINKVNEDKNHLNSKLDFLKTLLQQFDLPLTWSISELDDYLNVAWQISDIQEEHVKLKAELEMFYKSCGTDQIDEIRDLYNQQADHHQLEQEKVKLQAVVSTYFNDDYPKIKQKFLATTNAELVAKKAAISESIHNLEQAVDEGQTELGNLSAKQEILENNERQERLLLELEMLKYQADSLATDWSTYRVFQFVIEEVSKRYEQERQPEVLRFATEYFSQITNKKFTRVYAPLDTQQLKIESGRGSVCGVGELSQGSIEQLYLSLRLALVRTIKEQGVELPLVIDDILVNFDRHRRKQTVDLLKSISEKQQIIFLTCHRTMAEAFDTSYVSL